jgi:apolipoprotein N-acyltransferase
MRGDHPWQNQVFGFSLTLMEAVHPILEPPRLGRGLVFLVLSMLCFHLAYALPGWGWLICGYPVFLVQALPHLSPRQAFYFGIGVGLFCFGPQLHFFAELFNAAALALWLILALWIAFFLLIGRIALERWGSIIGGLSLPFCWTGLEYFRSELYYLRFSWLNTGYALSDTPLAPVLGVWGMYGIGWLLVGFGGAWLAAPWRKRCWILGTWVVVGTFPLLLPRTERTEIGNVAVAGMQLEESNPSELPQYLDRLAQAYPDAPLLVLHEYLVGGEPPAPIKQWCRNHQKWLVIGGKRTLAGDRWQNTAFVVGPEGTVVFEQGKSVPIQFFDDGVPAAEQTLWASPWGRIGIGICYDLSYTRVMDRLVRMGAQALVIPTMDAISWGAYQHGIHARVAPTRAHEYGLGIFRVASSGVSQLLSPAGDTLASAPCPGQEAIIGGRLSFVSGGHLPVDRWLAPFCVGWVILQVLWIGYCSSCRGYLTGRRSNV